MRRSECSTKAVRSAFTPDESFAVITFHNDFHPISSEVVSIARELSVAPIVLFENPFVESDERAFDLVIADHTSPTVWLKSLAEAIETAQKLQELSRELRRESAEARSRARALRRVSAHNRANSIDFDNIWGDHSGKPPRRR